MTPAEIIKMANEAGCGWTMNGTEPLLTTEEQIQRFAALVAEAEREACLRECKFGRSSADIEIAIRARGEK